MSQQEVNLFTSQKLGILMLNDDILKDILYWENNNNTNIFYDNFSTQNEELLFDLQKRNDINLHISVSRGNIKSRYQTFTKTTQDNKNILTRKINYLFDINLFIFTYNPSNNITTTIEGIKTRRDYFAYCFTLINDFCKNYGNVITTNNDGITNNTEFLQTNFNFQMLADDVLALKDVNYLNFKLNNFIPIKSK